MLIIQKTIFSAIGQQIGRKRIQKYYDRICDRIIRSPLLFIQLWLLPGLLHHLVFKVLIRVGPIVYFCLGVVCTLLLEIYLTLLVLSANENDYREHTRHHHPKKTLNVENRLKVLKDGSLKNVQEMHICDSQSSSEFNVSEIDKEELGIN